MSALRFLALVALALWTGGLVALAVSAPTMFAALEGQNPALGRVLGGLAFGAVFSEFQRVAWGLGSLLIVSLALRAALGPQPRRVRMRLWIATGMLAGSVVTARVIVPRIQAIQAAVTGPIASLAADDARRVDFGRLHGLAGVAMAMTVVAGLWMIWAEMRDTP